MVAWLAQAKPTLSRGTSSVHLFAFHSVARYSVADHWSLKRSVLERMGHALIQRRPRSPDRSQETSRRVLWRVVVIQETF